MQVELSTGELISLIKLVKRSPITGEEALPVAYLIQKLEGLLEPAQPEPDK